MIATPIDTLSTARTASNSETASSDITAKPGDIIAVESDASAVTVTLPAAPPVGTLVVIYDVGNFSLVNNITVNPNGKKLGGVVSNLILAVNGVFAEFIFISDVIGWIKK